MATSRRIGPQILAMYESGISYRKIKEELQCSLSTISYHVGEGQKKKLSDRTKNKNSKIRELIIKTKTDAVCADCKEDYPYYMMDFDHLGDKEFTIASVKGISLEKLQAEIDKCDVVCANCHRIRTHNRQLKHGAGVPDLYYGE